MKFDNLIAAADDFAELGGPPLNLRTPWEALKTSAKVGSISKQCQACMVIIYKSGGLLVSSIDL